MARLWDQCQLFAAQKKERTVFPLVAVLKGKARKITCPRETPEQESILQTFTKYPEQPSHYGFVLAGVRQLVLSAFPYHSRAGHQAGYWPHSKPCSCSKLPGGLQNIKRFWNSCTR